MEDKTFELLEKMYAEFISFRQEISDKVDNVDNKVDIIEKKADKNTILLEHIEDKIKILAEVQRNHLEINERQHEEMNEINKDQLDLLKSALQHAIHNR